MRNGIVIPRSPSDKLSANGKEAIFKAIKGFPV